MDLKTFNFCHWYCSGVITAALFTILLIIIHFSWQAAVVGGLGLVMSSTAIVLQIMHDRNMSNTESGRFGFSCITFSGYGGDPNIGAYSISCQWNG